MVEQPPLVNRDLELAKIEAYFKEACNASLPRIVNVCGIPGIGKSTLLKKLMASAYDTGRGLVCFVDLSMIEGRDLYAAKLQFLSLLSSFITEHYGEELAATLHVSAEQPDDSALDVALANFVQTLVAYPDPIMLVFDSWDYVAEQLFAWVEVNLLLSVAVRHKGIVYVMGSQAPLAWRQYDLRRHVEILQLDVLDSAHSAEQLRTFASIGATHDGPVALADTITSLTGGHPLANVIVQATLSEQAYPALWLRDNVGPLTLHLCGALLERMLPEAYEPRATFDRSLLQASFRVGAVLPEFDVRTLRKLLPVLVAPADMPSISTLMLLVRRLVEKNIATWSDETVSYRLAPALRHIFAQELYYNERNCYTALREAAITHYANLVHESRGIEDLFLGELILQILYKADPPSYNAFSPTSDLFADELRHTYAVAARTPPTSPAQLVAWFRQHPALRAGLAQHGIPWERARDLLEHRLAPPPSAS